MQEQNKNLGFVTVLIMVIGCILVLVLIGAFRGDIWGSAEETVSDTSNLREHSSGALVENGCQIGGCSSQICTTEDAMPPVSTCEFNPVYQCYKNNFAQCVSVGDSQCAWKETEALRSCRAQFSE